VRVRGQTVAFALAALALLAGCGGGSHSAPAGAPGPVPGGTLAGRVVDGPVAGALVTCIPVAPDGTVLGAALGPVVTGADGGFSITSTADVPGPILCTTAGGTDSGSAAPSLALVLPDGLMGGVALAAHINPFTTLAYDRLRAAGTFTADGIRAVSDALALSLGLSGDLWAAAYGGTAPDDLVMTGLLDAFDGALATLVAGGMTVPEAAAALIAALDGDTADGALDGQADGTPVLVDGTPLADLIPDLLPPTDPPTDPPPNAAPVADAGPDVETPPGTAATLDGTASADPDGDALAYLWTVTSRPAGSLAEPGDPTAAAPSFTPDLPGAYVLSLVVSDGTLDSAPDTAVVTAPAPANAPPVADAGPDTAVTVGIAVALDGTGSSDPDGDPITYLWAIDAAPAGSAVALSSATIARPVLTPDVAGDYALSLTVDDGALASAPATVTVTALPPPNAPPVADAGPDAAVTLGEAAALDGSASFDPDGDAITHLWAVTDRPAGALAEPADPAAASPSFTPDMAGAYTLSLTVNDGQIDSSPDVVTVTATAPANAPPVADAGPDRGVVVLTPVTLDGTGSSDPDGDAISFLWTLTDAPAGATAGLSAATDPAPAFTPDLPGVYAFSLTVSDGALDSGPDPVRITAADPTATGDPYTFNGLAPGDWLGYAVAGPGDVNGDGHADLAAGAFPSAASTGQVIVFDGADGSFLYSVAGEAEGDAFGRALGGAGDVDGDGLPDLVVGAPGADPAGNGSGRVRVLRGLDGAVLWSADGGASFDGLGASVAGAGDVNGDGRDDVIAGAPGADGNTGYARVYSGVGGAVLWTFPGDAPGDRAGAAVAGVGDLDGDGRDDVAVGFPGSGARTAGGGRVVVFSGADGALLLDIAGTDPYAGLGASVAGADDVDGDGAPDFLIGAPAYSGVAANAGRVELYGAGGARLRRWEGTLAQDQLGFSVAGAGDFDGDGTPDLMVGIVGSDAGGQSAGEARVLSGRDGSILATLHGAPYDGLGRSVAGMGDLDGDGYADVAAGAPGSDAGGADAGQVRAVPGGP
jgi:hypothetical protein